MMKKFRSVAVLVVAVVMVLGTLSVSAYTYEISSDEMQHPQR